MNRFPPTNDHSWNRSSIPCRAMLASSGEMTPPCGVPISVGVNTSPVNTPACNQP